MEHKRRNHDKERGGRESSASTKRPSRSAKAAALDGLMEGARPALTLSRTDETPAIQAGLAVSHPADHSEKEADELARRVVDGQPAEIHETGGMIDRDGPGSAETSAEFQAKLQSSKGSGRSLDESTRTEMESKMDADFSGVRIHLGSEAHALNEAVNAKAFTHRQDVYFAHGQYDPGSKSGQNLLAHELAHTQQQRTAIFRQAVGPDAAKADALVQYRKKLTETGKIQNDKPQAREAIRRWKLGHAAAILTLKQKKLLIDELLKGTSLPATDQSLVLDLADLSEAVNTTALCLYLGSRIKGPAEKGSRVGFTKGNYDRFLKIQSGRAKQASTSAGTFPSDNISALLDLAYKNSIRYISTSEHSDRINHPDTFIESDFRPYGDKKTPIECIDTVRRIVIANLFKGTPDYDAIVSIVKEYCINQDKKLKDASNVTRDNRMFDAMDALIKIGHAKLLKSFTFSKVSKDFPDLTDTEKDPKKVKTKQLPVPQKLKDSVWATINSETAGKEGWHAFGAAIVAGYHSITLLVNVRPGGPFMYWIDQLDKTKQGGGPEKFRVIEGTLPGARQIKPDQFDDYINYTTQSYWDNQRTNPKLIDGKKGWHDTASTFTLWKLSLDK